MITYPSVTGNQEKVISTNSITVFLIIIYYMCNDLNKVVINKSYDCHRLRQMITFIVPMQSRKL